MLSCACSANASLAELLLQQIQIPVIYILESLGRKLAKKLTE
jgi:hypothetical protein